MTPELFSDAMNEIGAKYVEEALTYKRPAQRSFWSKLAKRAAMVALVALLALSGFAAASPAARAAMIHWVETWTGSQVSYEYAGDAPTGELPFYAITALPDGYTLDEDMSYEDSGFRQLCYRSGDVPHLPCALLHVLRHSLSIHRTGKPSWNRGTYPKELSDSSDVLHNNP